MSTPITLPTRRLDPAFVEKLKSLTAGDSIRVTQTVRVGGRKWEAVTEGTFRGINYLATGVTTERVKEDDIVVPTVHFTKKNGELASISIDEQTRIEKV
ncbi:MAG: hypothetical protein LC104_21660 [Bacteroidales bacterium]|nr:hypothetical protein [Bacteroidales bacterium]